MFTHRTNRTRAFTAILGSAGWLLASAPAPDLTGTWDFRVVSKSGISTSTAVLSQIDQRVVGRFDSRYHLEGRVSNDSVFVVLALHPITDGPDITYTASIVTADSLNGNVDFGGRTSGAFTATRRR